MPPDRILVARRLLPSDTVSLPRGTVTGIVLEFGGPGSHAALLAEALGIPTVAQVENATSKIADEDEVIIDGIRGQVIVHPGKAMLKRYTAEIHDTRRQVFMPGNWPAKQHVRWTGQPVMVLANVGCRADALAAAENGADGAGGDAAWK